MVLIGTWTTLIKEETESKRRSDLDKIQIWKIRPDKLWTISFKKLLLKEMA